MCDISERFTSVCSEWPGSEQDDRTSEIILVISRFDGYVWLLEGEGYNISLWLFAPVSLTYDIQGK